MFHFCSVGGGAALTQCIMKPAVTAEQTLTLVSDLLSCPGLIVTERGADKVWLAQVRRVCSETRRFIAQCWGFYTTTLWCGKPQNERAWGHFDLMEVRLNEAPAWILKDQMRSSGAEREHEAAGLSREISQLLNEVSESFPEPGDVLRCLRSLVWFQRRTLTLKRDWNDHSKRRRRRVFFFDWIDWLLFKLDQFCALNRLRKEKKSSRYWRTLMFLLGSSGTFQGTEKVCVLFLKRLISHFLPSFMSFSQVSSADRSKAARLL